MSFRAFFINGPVRGQWMEFPSHMTEIVISAPSPINSADKASMPKEPFEKHLYKEIFHSDLMEMGIFYDGPIDAGFHEVVNAILRQAVIQSGRT